jgi:parvulin-like peptidyl-prolyl isomerase
VAGLVLIPYYTHYVAPWRQPVLEVKNSVYDMEYFVKFLRLFMSGPNLDVAVPMQALTNIQRLELIRQEALRREIRVSPSEVTQRLKNRVADSDADEGAFQDRYRALLERTGLSDDEYRELVEAGLLREKLRDELGKELPKTVEQIHVHGFPVDTAEKAQEIRDRLAQGEDFALLAKTESLDPESKENGGDLGWWPKGVGNIVLSAHLRARGLMTRAEEEAQKAREEIESGSDFAAVAAELSLHAPSRARGGDLGWLAPGDMDARFDAAVSALEPGTVSDPIVTPDGYWIAEVLERAPEGNLIDDVAFNLSPGEISPPLRAANGYYLIRVVEPPTEREPTPDQLDSLKDRALETWLQDTARQGADEGWIKWYWDSARYAWVNEHVTN